MNRCIAMSIAAVSLTCAERQVARIDPHPTGEAQNEFLLSGERKLDLLFVIDNSGSMEGEQQSLARNFPLMAERLGRIDGGLPNLHLAVVSTDLGAGVQGVDSDCTGVGDNGEFQNSPPAGESCEVPDGAYIIDEGAQADGKRNYKGDLGDVFSCMARLGAEGCRFEQSLEAMRRALDGTNSKNAGFLRDDAVLAVVILTDEDDCSASDTGVFDPGQTALDSTLGPPHSFRCFEFGVVCDDDSPRTVGLRQQCRPREDSPYMEKVAAYTDFLKGLKGAQERLFVAGIIGPSTPVEVRLRGEGDGRFYDIAPSCSDGDDQARPPIRLESFFKSFTNRQVASVCDDDLSVALKQIADALAETLDRNCLTGTPMDVDAEEPGVQRDCTVEQVSATERRALAECDNTDMPSASSNLPCYTMREDQATCDTAPHLSVEAFHADDAPRALLEVRCRTL